MSPTSATSCSVSPRPSENENKAGSSARACAVCLNALPRKGGKGRSGSGRGSGRGSAEAEAEAVVKLKCGHRFHPQCIKRWYGECMSGGNTCPMCRSPVRFAGRSFLYNVLIISFRHRHYRHWLTASSQFKSESHRDSAELVEWLCPFLYHDNAANVDFRNVRDLKVHHTRSCFHRTRVMNRE